MTAVQPAFLRFPLPPPSAGELGLAGPDCTGARCAADRRKAPVVQGIVGNAVFADERENPLARPVEQRVDLDQPMMRIDNGKRDAGALMRLIGAQAGDPCRGPREGAPERLDLATLEEAFTSIRRAGGLGAHVSARGSDWFIRPALIAVLTISSLKLVGAGNNLLLGAIGTSVVALAALLTVETRNRRRLATRARDLTSTG